MIKKIVCIFVLAFMFGCIAQCVLGKSQIVNLGALDWTPEVYKLIKTLDKATIFDITTVYIYSPGGRLDVMDEIADHMRTSSGTVKCVTGPIIASAATILFFKACNPIHRVLNPSTFVMFHYPFKCKDMKCTQKQPAVGNERFEYLHEYLTSFPFLTNTEQDNMYTHNKDLMLMGGEILRRQSL